MRFVRIAIATLTTLAGATQSSHRPSHPESGAGHFTGFQPSHPHHSGGGGTSHADGHRGQQHQHPNHHGPGGGCKGDCRKMKGVHHHPDLDHDDVKVVEVRPAPPKGGHHDEPSRHGHGSGPPKHGHGSGPSNHGHGPKERCDQHDCSSDHHRDSHCRKYCPKKNQHPHRPHHSNPPPMKHDPYHQPQHGHDHQHHHHGYQPPTSPKYHHNPNPKSPTHHQPQHHQHGGCQPPCKANNNNKNHDHHKQQHHHHKSRPANEWECGTGSSNPPSHGCEDDTCVPGTYACTGNPQTAVPGWKVCNAEGKFQYGGDCPPHTVCKFYEPSKSPYCVPWDFRL